MLSSYNSYEQQREILSNAFEAIGQKRELLLTTGQILMESGADTNRIIRDVTRVAAFMGIPQEKLHLHITYTTIMLNISDESHSYTSFRKCLVHVVNLWKISAVSRLTWRALREHYTLEEYRENLERIRNQSRGYSTTLTIIATGIACGAFCKLFGCDWYAFIYTSIATMLGTFCQRRLIAYGVNHFAAMTFGAFSSTLVAYFSMIQTFFPISETPYHPMIACALYIVPGVPLINAVNDLINVMLVSGITRAVHTLLITGGMTFGIVFAIGIFHVDTFTKLATVSSDGFILSGIFAAIAAMGFSVIFNLPRRLMLAAGVGGAISICIRNFLMSIGMSQIAASFFAATIISLIALKAIHWFHTPTHVLTVPSVIPMIPGVLLYRVLFSIIHIHNLTIVEFLSTLQSGVDAIMIILGISIGASIPNILGNKFIDQQKQKKIDMLLSEEYETR